MTFWYDKEADELIGNVAFDDEYGYAEQDGTDLRIDVTTIMENGRGEGKLREMKGAIDDALEAHGNDT